MSNLRQTPLHEWHRSHGGRLVEFAGWEMPIRYDSVIAEHMAVRQDCGLFDVSHMGELAVRGAGARAAVDGLVTNDVSGLAHGQVLYTALCRGSGTVLDDLLVYCLAEGDFLIVCNASNREKVSQWFAEHLTGDAELKDESDATALFALQGPRAVEVLKNWSGASALHHELDSLEYYHLRRTELSGVPALVSRTGYTGERGYELYVPVDQAAMLWEQLVAAGQDHGLKPIGLGARDTLRLEAGYSLYGHELDEDTTPYEAGIGWVVRLKTEADFIGKSALAAQKKAGPARRTVALTLPGRNIPRQDSEVRVDGQSVGQITSGTFSPVMQQGIGLARIEAGAVDAALAVQVRGQDVAAQRVKLPFVPSHVKD